jgi:hypothetical protein
MTKSVHNGQDIIDSRDVIARIDELESDLQSRHEAARETWSDTPEDEREEDEEPAADFDQWLKDNAEVEEDASELIALRALAEEASGYAADWQYGEALIRESYFDEYAQQLAEDIGAINRDAQWPNNHIDWEAAADELRQDYTAVDFDGVTYYIR